MRLYTIYSACFICCALLLVGAGVRAQSPETPTPTETVAAGPAPIVISGAPGAASWVLDPQTLRLEARLGGSGEPIVVSEGLGPTTRPLSLRMPPLVERPSNSPGLWRVRHSARGLSVDVKALADGGIEVRFDCGVVQEVAWPRMRLDAGADTLVWPRGGGVRFALRDAFWRKEILGEDWAVIESMSVPVWGVERGEAMVSWMSGSPIRETIRFADSESSSPLLVVAHEFSAKGVSKPAVMRFHVEGRGDVLAPGRHFRKYLEETKQFVSLEEKAGRRPGVDRLRGAIHVYLWGAGAVAATDVPRDRWSPFCRQLLAESRATTETLGRTLKPLMGEDAWKAVVEVSKSSRPPYEYLKTDVSAGLSKAVSSGETFRQSATWERVAGKLPAPAAELWVRARQTRGEGISTSESLLLNSHLLALGYPKAFATPPEQWGDGVSLGMLDALEKAGVRRAKLCVDATAGLEARPWVAESAAARGWLIGPYDSYHSVHDPKYAGSDLSWETAQMAPGMFENASVLGADGKHRKGFKGLGRILNSMLGRGYFERRVTANMEATRSNYYFIDCDATGELFDDFSPAHPQTKEQDAGARCDRLEWIAETFGVVVGSEGGNAFAAGSIDVGEGVFGPFFGWDDADMKDPKSPYFRGRYWPPHGPDVYFKPVKLKDRFRRLQYDPASRIPLYGVVFHDSVVATHHWNNGHFKYPEVRQVLALLEVLHLAPPMVHLNQGELAKRRALLKEHYEVWSPLHERFGFARLESFARLSDDGLVQEARYAGGCRIVVNFGSAEATVRREGDALMIPPLSAVIVAPGVWDGVKVYSPGGEKAK